MSTSLRKLNLTAHVSASVGWLGAFAVFFAHSLASVLSQDALVVRSAALAMGLIAWVVILPLSLASLATGLVQAMGTAWGLLRHYWVLFKLVLTTIATIVLLLKLEPIGFLANMARETSFSGIDHTGLTTSLLVHAGGGLLVLLAAVTLAVYKPSGMTPYGLRKLRGTRSVQATEAGVGGMERPRWARVFGRVVISVLLLVAVMFLLGGHGPGMHASR